MITVELNQKMNKADRTMYAQLVKSGKTDKQAREIVQGCSRRFVLRKRAQGEI